MFNKIYKEVTENLNDDNEMEVQENINQDDVLLDCEESHFKNEDVVEVIASKFEKIKNILEKTECKIFFNF